MKQKNPFKNQKILKITPFYLSLTTIATSFAIDENTTKNFNQIELILLECSYSKSLIKENYHKFKIP